MKTSTSERKHGIKCTVCMHLDDLDFADELALLSHTHQKMKSTTLKYNTKNTNATTLRGETLEDVETFAYLVNSIIDEQRGSDADVKGRIDKTRAAFIQLNNIWNSKLLSTNIEVTIFNINVKTVLLQGDESLRTTTTLINKVQVFINSCLHKIFNARWSDTINNSL
ncbi:unnamed protein product [Schistosoma margrebowiei]|uniref:Uncharacterized protein n=1 Tax=Schistosoma margrebowiei TaxID=48269 RepID=A0A183MV13_9TREM|nr:unnamed protein product [Schistosoma margrebowiei]